MSVKLTYLASIYLAILGVVLYPCDRSALTPRFDVDMCCIYVSRCSKSKPDFIELSFVGIEDIVIRNTITIEKDADLADAAKMMIKL
jgi:CBS domain-containing protein